jgi:transcriptional regulator with XRE-family HTH domain
MTSVRENVIRLRTRYPNLPGAEIARRTGVSRQRVSEILHDANLPASWLDYLTADERAAVQALRRDIARARFNLAGLRKTAQSRLKKKNSS